MPCGDFSDMPGYFQFLKSQERRVTAPAAGDLRCLRDALNDLSPAVPGWARVSEDGSWFAGADDNRPPEDGGERRLLQWWRDMSRRRQCELLRCIERDRR